MVQLLLLVLMRRTIASKTKAESSKKMEKKGIISIGSV
jgi:hypothetical protein